MWASREVEIFLMFAGQMGCEALNFALKRYIREERPSRMCDVYQTSLSLTPVTEMHGKGYGMPSSHSQFVAFFSLSLSLFLLLRHSPSPPTSYSPTTMTQRALLSILACFCAGTVAASRVYLSYHTPRQVLAGVAAGAISAIAWFIFTTMLRNYGWIEWALDLPLARLLRMRDLITMEDLTDAGWARYEDRRKMRKSNVEKSKKKCR